MQHLAVKSPHLLPSPEYLEYVPYGGLCLNPVLDLTKTQIHKQEMTQKDTGGKLSLSPMVRNYADIFCTRLD